MACLIVGLYALPCHAADAERKFDSSSPIIITARSLVADNRQKTVTYNKNVVVKKDDVTMYAEEVVINLAKTGGGGAADTGLFKGAGKIETITAKGGVKIIQKDKTATANEAVYYSDGDRIVLTGSPRVWQGTNVLSGSKIVYNLKDDTFSVEEAKTILYQQEGAAPAPQADK